MPSRLVVAKPADALHAFHKVCSPPLMKKNLVLVVHEAMERGSTKKKSSSKLHWLGVRSRWPLVGDFRTRKCFNRDFKRRKGARLSPRGIGKHMAGVLFVNLDPQPRAGALEWIFCIRCYGETRRLYPFEGRGENDQLLFLVRRSSIFATGQLANRWAFPKGKLSCCRKRNMCRRIASALLKSDCGAALRPPAEWSVAVEI